MPLFAKLLVRLPRYKVTDRFLRRLSTDQIKSDINSSFNDDQTKLILSTLNSITPPELAKTELIPISRAISFCRWRDSMGGFQQVSDVMKITGIGHILADKLCSYFINELSHPESHAMDSIRKNPGSSTSGCIPRLSSLRARSVQSFAALDIGQNQVTWCTFYREPSAENDLLIVQEWNRTQFLETPFVATKHSHAMLHEKMADVIFRHLPRNVDCYITEYKRLRCPTLKFMPLIINQVIAETVLLTLLNCEAYNPQTQLHKVFKLRPSVVTRLFGLSVGNERVSGHRIVESVIEKRPIDGITPASESLPIELSPSALLRYRQIGEMEKESFNVSFLLGVAFYELVLKAADLSNETALPIS